MNKHLLSVFALGGFTLSSAFAQVANYSFTQNVGTYTELTNPTVLATASSTDDLENTAYTTTLPFVFNFNGVDYTTIHVYAAGYVSFGTESILGTYYQYKPLTQDTAHEGIIAVCNEKLVGLNNDGKVGEISYKVEGVAPNREFVIQWKDFTRYRFMGYDTDRYELNFQLRLQENQNVIKKVYQATAVGNPSVEFITVGLRGTTSADFAVRESSTGVWSATTAGETKYKTISITPSTLPQSGLTYTWTPSGISTPTTCPAVATFDFTFENNTTETLFSTDCWKGTHTSFPTVSVTNAAGGTGDIALPDKVLQIYKSGTITTPITLVTPEVSSTNGTHALSFDIELALAGTPTAIDGNEKIIVGTMSDANDFSTFVATNQEFAVNQTGTFTTAPIVFPTNHKYVAIRFDFGVAGHKALIVDNIKWQEAPAQETCPAVNTFTYDFENQTNATVFETGCWKGTHTSYPTISITNMGGMGGNIQLSDYVMQVYKGGSVSTPITLVTPKVSTTSGTHVLSFDIESAITGMAITGTEKIVIGTMSDNTDFTTFVSTGQEFAVSESGSFTTAPITFPANHQYVAIQLDLGTSGHKVVVLDNIKWDVPLSTPKLDKNAVKLFPNPVSDILYVETDELIKEIAIYDTVGKMIDSTEKFFINVNSLEKGIYILKVENQAGAIGNYKFIKQ
ncbi:T9SS type A sorting domain-containing protein [Capnocytophaga sp. ARDL2]|uniref:T9SS type A sorting domain-containing protein n=1 Tax=Capnocytophaga sp. ARDL2 TaxID=3238809 RepID=UPI0035561C8D